MFKELDFKPGKITYDDFNIKPDIPFKEQIYSLKEDLFQVSYDDKYTIDIGWSPDFEVNGKFKVRIIKDYDWSNPLYLKQTNNLTKLDKYVEECAALVKEFLKRN